MARATGLDARRWPDERAAARSSARRPSIVRESALLGSDLWVFRAPRPLPTSLYSMSHNNAAAPVRQSKRRRNISSAIMHSAKRYCASLRSRRRPGKVAVVVLPATQGTLFHLCKELDMFCKPQSVRNAVLAAATLSLAASGVAFADDSSIARLTGDSYAYFNNMDYSPGKFNVERTPRTQDGSTVAKSPAKLPAYSDPAMMSSARRDVDKSTSPIRDDRGG